MILRFPHVRLAMLNRLADCGDCETAFRETAQALGFDVSQERHRTDDNECASLQTAYAILQKAVPVRADAVFKTLSVEVKQYQKQFKGKAHLPMRMRSKDRCDGMGAIVMDFLLQLIEAESLETTPAVNQSVTPVHAASP